MTDSSDVSHVRWIAGGTGAGKSTVSRILAERYRLEVYNGDLAEHYYLQRMDPRRQPRMAAGARMTPEERLTGRTGKDLFESMGSRFGENFPFMLEDLVAMSGRGTVLADDFRTRPSDVAPLLEWREQAVFLLPTAEFRREKLTERYADPARARANWGSFDPRRALEMRLERDRYFDAELRAEAAAFGLPVIEVDGSVAPDALADDLAVRFRLS